MRSVELFSGCGGMALGLSRSGFGHEFMAEWNGVAVATALHNKALGVEHVAHWPIAKADVRDVDWSRFAGIDLVAGGPPCQPFSVGGKAKGSEDARDMWPTAIRAVREIAPTAFAFENVKGLLRPAFESYLRWIAASLERPSLTRLDETPAGALDRLGSSSSPSEYSVVVVKANAADFGAPQKRHRVIIAGVRSDVAGSLVAPVPTHSRARLLWEQWVTGEYWTRHGLPIPSDDAMERADVALVAKLRRSGAPDDKAWLTVRDALAGLGEPDGANNHVLQPGARSYPGHTGSALDHPAKALKAGVHGVPGGENMLVRDDGTVRYFSVREAARLQGMPDEYQFPGAWSQSMKQLGNAVPVHLSEAIGKWLAHSLMFGKYERIAA